MKHTFTMALALALCGLAAPAIASNLSNPCSLLSLAEAQSVTHLSLTDPSPNPMRADGGQDKNATCTYQNDQPQMVSVMLHDDPAFFPGNAKNANTTGFKKVKGIGQSAWTVANAMAVSVEILKDGRYVSVRVADPNGLKDRGAQNYASAIKLAKLVAGRM